MENEEEMEDASTINDQSFNQLSIQSNSGTDTEVGSLVNSVGSQDPEISLSAARQMVDEFSMRTRDSLLSDDNISRIVRVRLQFFLVLTALKYSLFTSFSFILSGLLIATVMVVEH